LLVGLSSGLHGALLLHLVVDVEEAKTCENESDKEEYNLEGDVASFIEFGLSLGRNFSYLGN
jgi:hypothetical protein